MENKDPLYSSMQEANNLYKEVTKTVCAAKRMKEEAIETLHRAEDRQADAAKVLEKAFRDLRESDIKRLKE